jgi:hypothetical protein
LKERETVSRADLVFVGSLVSFCILVFAVLNIAGSIGAFGNSSASMIPSSSPLPDRSPQTSAIATLTATKDSAGPFYLDGAYSLSFTVTHPSEQCLLVVHARAAGESIGTDLFTGVVTGNTGTFPALQQSFDWDDAMFYGEEYTITREGACQEARVTLTSLNLNSGSPTPLPTSTPAIIPSPIPSPSLAPSPSDLASENVCSFVRATVTDTAAEGGLAYEFGRISLREMGSVYRDWANRAEELLGMNSEAKKSIKREVNQTIEFALKTASAAKSGNSNLALDYSGRFLNGKVYRVCSGY